MRLKGLIGKAEPRMGEVRRADLQAGEGLLPTMNQGFGSPERDAMAEALQQRSQKIALAGQDMPNVSPEDVDTEEMIMDAGQMSGGIKKTGDLAMDLASRMARAKQMGFDTTNKMYHGTEQVFKEFTPSKSGHAGPGVYLTPDINAANNFGENILPLYTSTKKPLTLGKYAPDDEAVIRKVLTELGAEKYMPKSQSLHFTDSYHAIIDGLRKKLMAEHPEMKEEIIGNNMSQYLQDQLKKAGYDRIDYTWNESPASVIFDPSQIRHSEKAVFDPKKKKSANILAGAAGAGLLAGAQEE